MKKCVQLNFKKCVKSDKKLQVLRRAGVACDASCDTLEEARLAVYLRTATAVLSQPPNLIDNLLVRIHFIIVMIRWTGLAVYLRAATAVLTAVLDYLVCALTILCVS